MTKIERFENIESWKFAREITKLVYAASSIGNFSKDFALVNQIRRASISILSNIAEGFERGGNKEFLQVFSDCQRLVWRSSCAALRRLRPKLY